MAKRYLPMTQVLVAIGTGVIALLFVVIIGFSIWRSQMLEVDCLRCKRSFYIENFSDLDIMRKSFIRRRCPVCGCETSVMELEFFGNPR